MKMTADLVVAAQGATHSAALESPEANKNSLIALPANRADTPELSEANQQPQSDAQAVAINTDASRAMVRVSNLYSGHERVVSVCQGMLVLSSFMFQAACCLLRPVRQIPSAVICGIAW